MYVFIAIYHIECEETHPRGPHIVSEEINLRGPHIVSEETDLIIE